jgi:hypothetical protein
MNLLVTPFFLLLFLAACTNKQPNEQQYAPKGSLLVFDSTSGKYVVSATDKKLISTWETFTEAVSKGDLTTLRELSLDSIICHNCVSIDERPTMVADTFYVKHAQKLFSKSFAALILDSSKIKCSYDLDSTYFYAYRFLMTASDITKPKLAVMFVEYPALKTNGDGEHNSGLLGFLETKNGYKYFGYSTIP